jgi:hypothetical protein
MLSQILAISFEVPFCCVYIVSRQRKSPDSWSGPLQIRWAQSKRIMGVCPMQSHATGLKQSIERDEYLVSLNDPIVESLLFILNGKEAEEVRKATLRLAAIVELYAAHGDTKPFRIQVLPNRRL